MSETEHALAEALDKCRAVIKFHVQPGKCVCIGDAVISARDAYESAVAALTQSRNGTPDNG